MTTQYRSHDASVGVVWSLLSDPKGRIALSELLEANGRLSRSALARLVVAEETEATTDDGDAVRRTELELHHSILPKLDEANIVNYDTEAGVVHPVTDRPGNVDSLETSMQAVVTALEDH
jgi:hypothetical protein